MELRTIKKGNKGLDGNRKKGYGSKNTKKGHQYVYQLKTIQEIHLENQFKILKQHAINNGWTNAHFREYTRIRQELREKWKEKCNKNWKENIIKAAKIKSELVKHSKNSKDFWNTFNLLKGTIGKILDGNKCYTGHENCNWWRALGDIFRITEEKAKFDNNFNTLMTILISRHRISSYSISNLSRLNNENFQTREIDKKEIKRYIQKF